MATATATRGDATMEVAEISPPSVDGGIGEKSDDERTEGGNNEADRVDAEEVSAGESPLDLLRRDDDYCTRRDKPSLWVLARPSAQGQMRGETGRRQVGVTLDPDLTRLTYLSTPPLPQSRGTPMPKSMVDLRPLRKEVLRQNLTWSLRAPR